MPMSAIDLVNRIGAVDDTAGELGIRPELLHAVMRQESGGNPKAVSPKGAMGLMQTIPSTARDPGFGVKPFNPANPEENLRGGASYLKAMLDRYQGDEEKALAAYNAGPGTVDKAGGVPNFPETQTYVKSILGRAQASPAAAPQATAVAPRLSAIDLVNSLAMAPAKAKETSQEAVARLAKEREAPAQESGTMRFLKGAWENLNPVAAVEGLAQAASDPKGTYNRMVDASAEQFTKAKADYDQGRYSEMLGHGAAGALPIIGPAAAKAGETIADGDIAGGLGQGAGLLGSVVAPEIAAKGVKKIGATLSKGAERIIRSNVKPDMSLMQRNPGPAGDIPRTILDEKFKPGVKGRDQALALTKKLSDQVTELNAADAASGRKYGLDDLEQALLDKRAHYLQSPAGAGDVAAIDSALDELRNHSLYSKKVVVQPGIPGTTLAEEMSGYPKRAAQAEITRQKLVPQDASTLDTMKRGIYEENPKAYGERKGAVVEGDKAMGRALKNIMDDNVPGVKELNARQSKVIVARKALGKMTEREANKYPLGLMDLAAASAAGVGGAVAGPIGVIPPIIAALLKHPTTAFPIARLVDKAGKTTRGLATPVNIAGKAGIAGNQIVNAQQRPLNIDEAKRLYQQYLDNQPQ
jgi:transglycosylase-like protein with SLT domain